MAKAKPTQKPQASGSGMYSYLLRIPKREALPALERADSRSISFKEYIRTLIRKDLNR